MKHNKGIGLSALALSVALALSGCGDKPEGEEKKATQVAAKVGKSEITVHQLNFELGKLGNNVPAEQSQQVANRVLKSLVDQELLMQKAIDEKVDRDPKVVQTLESTRRQILAQAYVERLTQNTPQPGEAEIKDYFDKNPALFSERRIYRLQELSVQVTPENAEAVKAKLGATRNLGEFVEWLKVENIPARGAQSVKNAEQLPLELLPRLHALKDGQALTLSAGNLLNIVYLAGSQSQPISLDQAKPMIERYLANAQKREVAEAELKRLREAAKVEYLGDYSEAGKEAAAAPAAPAATPAPAEGAPMEKDALEQGLKGLN